MLTVRYQNMRTIKYCHCGTVGGSERVRGMDAGCSGCHDSQSTVIQFLTSGTGDLVTAEVKNYLKGVYIYRPR
jgi:hypothetical protein